MKTSRALEIAKKIDEYVRDYGCSNGTINLLDDLIDELEALKNKSCENCKYKLQNECSANFLIVCKRHPRLPDHYEESK